MTWRWERSVARRVPKERDYRLGYLRARGSGELKGFLMLRRAPMERPGELPVETLGVVTVLDWAAPYGDRAARRALVAHGLASAQAMGGEIFEFTTTDADMQSILRARSFVKLGGYRMYYYGAKGTPLAAPDPERFVEWWWNGCDTEDAFTW